MGKNVAYLYQRIEGIDRVRKAYIMYENTPVGEIYHEYCSDSGEFDWVIKILWDNWDMMERQGKHMDLAGIDSDTRQAEYIRRYDPEFVTQRVPPKCRNDVRQLLKDIDLKRYDAFEILCRTHGKCGNDDYYVSRTPDKVIDVNRIGFDYDIPDFDTKEYGWL
jgi:hypothetical protein